MGLMGMSSFSRNLIPMNSLREGPVLGENI